LPVRPTVRIFVYRIEHGGRPVAVVLTVAQDLLPATVGSVDGAGPLTAPLVEDRRQHLAPLVVPHQPHPAGGGRLAPELPTSFVNRCFDVLRRHPVPEPVVD